MIRREGLLFQLSSFNEIKSSNEMIWSFSATALGCGNGTATIFQNPSGWQQIYNHAIAPVFHSIMEFRYTIKRPGQTCRKKFHRFQNIRHNDIHIDRDARITVFLHRQPADDQMRNVMISQQLDRGTGRLHQTGCPGVLAENISSLVRHEDRIARNPDSAPSLWSYGLVARMSGDGPPASNLRGFLNPAWRNHSLISAKV